MARYCIKYHSTTLAALVRRAEQQKLPLPAWRFNFPKLDLKMEIYDSVKKTTNINLHTGLNIVVDLEADAVEKAIEISKTFAETVLNLVSFSVSAYCTPAKLVSTISIANKEPHPFKHYVYPFDGQELVSPLAIMDEATFGSLFQAYDTCPYQQRTMRALTWLRKGIGEEATADEFIAYWVGLEAVKHILRRNLKMKARNPQEWAGGWKTSSQISCAIKVLVTSKRVVGTDCCTESESRIMHLCKN